MKSKEGIMEKSEMIKIASMAIEKGLSYENLYYCDDMYGNEDLTDDVWEYVVESMEIGTTAFKEKYKEA